MNRMLSYIAGAAVATLLMWPAASTAMAAGAPPAANAPRAATSTLVDRIRDEDDRGRWRGGDRDDDRRVDRDRNRRWGDRDRDRHWGGGWRYRCRIVRFQCADHFGWGNWRFRRCLWRRGCF